MKKKNFSWSLLIMILFTILFIVVFVRCSDTIDAPEKKQEMSLSKIEQSIVSSSSQFGFTLLKEINNSKKTENIFISPLSVSMAFGMVLNGAKNETYDEIKFALGLNGLTQEEINTNYKSVIKALSNVDGQVQFQSANSIWCRSDFSVEQSFLDVNKDFFNALVQSADFNNPATVNLINDWVKQNTNSKIEEIIDRINPEAVMYLINAIYFKGMWKYKFDKSLTTDDNFFVPGSGEITCKMMKQENDFNYFSDPVYKAIDLAYGNGSFKMMVLLPDKSMTVDDVLKNMNQEEFDKIIKGLEKQHFTLMIPKFKLESDLKINDILISLGMQKTFDPDKADFTNINKNTNLYISEAKHKTFVNVDEEGTEAAAVTSVEISLTSINDRIVKIDRPFLFLIYESTSRSILFIGKVVNPSIN